MFLTNMTKKSCTMRCSYWYLFFQSDRLICYAISKRLVKKRFDVSMRSKLSRTEGLF